MAPKSKFVPSRNPLHSGASSSFDPTPSHIWFRDEDARKAFLENFSRQGIHSKRRVILADFANTDLPDVIHSRGQESLCDVLVTCPSVLIQEFYSNMHRFDFSVTLFHTCVRGMRIIVTPKLVSDVLCVLKVEFPDYLGCECLRTMSKDELKSAFCESPFDQGERQFTYCSDFAKGPRFFNMVMTFVLHLFLTITLSQSLVRDICCPLLSILPQIFLLTLFCLSQIFIGIRCPVISSSFLWLSRGSHAILLFPFQHSTISLSCVPQTSLPLNIARRSLGRGSLGQQLLPPIRFHLSLLHSHLLLPLL